MNDIKLFRIEIGKPDNNFGTSWSSFGGTTAYFVLAKEYDEALLKLERYLIDRPVERESVVGYDGSLVINQDEGEKMIKSISIVATNIIS